MIKLHLLNSSSTSTDDDTSLSDVDQKDSVFIRFANPTSDEDLKKAKENSKAINIVKATTWAFNIWKQWSSYRRQVCSATECPPANLQQSTKQEMDFWLSKFILEVRKANGDEYTPNSLYSICCGMMRYIREVKPEVNFFTSPVFTGLQRTLDGEMKRQRALGQGVKRKRAEPITINEEDAMWA